MHAEMVDCAPEVTEEQVCDSVCFEVGDVCRLDPGLRKQAPCHIAEKTLSSVDSAATVQRPLDPRKGRRGQQIVAKAVSVLEKSEIVGTDHLFGGH